MKSYQVPEPGMPLQEVDSPTPKPTGKEVVLKTIACGVCHTDLHLHSGAFDLGEGNKLNVPVPNPFTLGHEVFGEVVAVGPNANNVSIGDKRIVYPWIGCSKCDVCDEGNEHLCSSGPVIGVMMPGGFGDHVIVPDSKYLHDAGDTPEHLAGSYACSGLTAYSALKKGAPFSSDNDLIIIGIGGVGMMGLQIAKAAFNCNPIVVDVDEQKLKLAIENGASAAINPMDDDAASKVLEITGGNASVAIDFVGSEQSTAFGTNLLRKGGKYIIVGLYGGELKLPLPLIPILERAVQGSYTGSPEDMHELMELVRSGKVDPIPVEKRPAREANQTLEDLKNGKIIGRAALMHD
tara:strand:+ start:65 stop:1111 length:1047 start_codon:yes stop_codon:yes gene_type:complete